MADSALVLDSGLNAMLISHLASPRSADTMPRGDNPWIVRAIALAHGLYSLWQQSVDCPRKAWIHSLTTQSVGCFKHNILYVCCEHEEIHMYVTSIYNWNRMFTLRSLFPSTCLVPAFIKCHSFTFCMLLDVVYEHRK